MISGKEVELDVAVSDSQLPRVSGQSAVSTQSTDTPVMCGVVPETPQPQASRHFVAPTSFYASKPKVKGQRYEISMMILILYIKHL